MFILIVLIIFSIIYTNRIFIKMSQNADKIKTLIRSCARWSLASLQDKSPLIAVLHANYGAGYLWALTEIFTDYEIKTTTGLDIIEFSERVTYIQDIATKRLIGICPNISRDLDVTLLKIAGEMDKKLNL